LYNINAVHLPFRYLDKNPRSDSIWIVLDTPLWKKKNIYDLHVRKKRKEKSTFAYNLNTAGLFCIRKNKKKTQQ